jgi:large subunit ribosomal protein L28
LCSARCAATNCAATKIFLKEEKVFLAFAGSVCYYIKAVYSKNRENAQARRCFNMAKCQFCDKGVTFGIKVSHSHRRTNRSWKPNVKRVKAIVDGTPQHVYVCTRCLRSGKVTRAV